MLTLSPKYRFICILLLLAGSIPAGSFAQGGLELWYSKPAADWNEALPAGSGRMGAMVFGGTHEELIQLNDESLWTGGPADPDPNPDAFNHLAAVRQALFNDSIPAAIKQLKKMQGPNTNMYQPLGDLLLTQQIDGTVQDYRRSLDIANATIHTSFSANGVLFTRALLASAPDSIIVIRLTASRKGALNYRINVKHELQYEKSVEDGKDLVLKGKARIYSDEKRSIRPMIFSDSLQCNGMRFQFRVRLLSAGGTITALGDTALSLTNATEALLLIASGTSFNGYDHCPDKDGREEAALARRTMDKAAAKTWQQLLAAHQQDYKQYFNKVSLYLDSDKAPAKPTDQRLADYKNGAADQALEMLYYQFGRYLLISSSRPGGIPANLQGIWNANIRPSWRSNFTTNINIQMNYWPAEPTNLSALTAPLVTFIERLAKNGTATAQNYYHARGWAVHHNSDIWAQTNPVGEGSGDPKWANWSMGSPWLSQHLYEHYRFTGNKKFLTDTAYPLMKTAALFCIDWLVEKDGILVTAPSTSPENVYIHPTGYKGTVTVASAMDMEIIWDLFTSTIEAAETLGIDRAFADTLRKKRALLSPLKVGANGNLVEWFGDWKDDDPQHRHVSHLFALHPGREISPLLDTTLSNACRRTLEVRGDGGTGWSKAWKINFWARLLDGDHAYKMYAELLKTSTLNNLFDTHPPFQIDGNFGATAGITEMLLQSHLGELHLLPALPRVWQRGTVSGLIARGNFVVGITWAHGSISSAAITASNGGICKIRTDRKMVIKGVKATTSTEQKAGKTYYITRFTTVKGGQYMLYGG